MIHGEAFAQSIVQRAIKRGSHQAELLLITADERATTVRLRELEAVTADNLVEANIRVLLGRRSGVACTTDLSSAGIDLLISSALENASLSDDDAHAGLPEVSECRNRGIVLAPYAAGIEHLEVQHCTRLARDTEEAALACDSRIAGSDGASCNSIISKRVLANSQGFVGSYTASEYSIDVVPIAKDGEFMERGYWNSSSCSLTGLEPPGLVGRTAAKRAVRHLRSCKVPTGHFPVVFEGRAANALLLDLFSCIHGRTVYRKTSCLADLLGVQIASEKLTVVDDGTLPGFVGSAPFDDEGVSTRRTVIIHRGVLTSYILNTYAGRMLGLRTTGNAVRAHGNGGISHHNLFIENGASNPSAIISSVKNGLYVTDLMGSGLDIASGGFSRGARGLWISGGEFAFPVSGITIAGNFRQMLMDIDAIGSDLDFRISVAAPTLLIGRLTVAGI